MAYSETTSTGWFGRIGNAIKGVLFGIVMVPVAIGVLILNERNAVRDIRANAELGGKVVSVASDAVAPSNEGKLIHLNGLAHTDELLKNEGFGIESKAIRISWNALIYQWKESSSQNTRKKLGGGEETVTTYNYQQVWSPQLIDSSRFKEVGHKNVGTKKFASGSVQARHVTLGAYELPDGLVSQIHSYDPLRIEHLPQSLADRGRVSDGVFYTGDPSAPRIGDEKVAFSITRPGNVSVIAVQTGNSFKPFVATNGKQKFLLYEGLLSADDMVKGEARKAMLLRWVLRGVGVLIMFLGFVLIFRPLSVLADVVPIFGSLVGAATGGIALLLSGAISFVIMAVSWLFFRPLLGFSLLLLAAGCLVGLIVMIAKGRSKARVAG